MVITTKNPNFEISGKMDAGKLNLTMRVINEKHINTKSLPGTIPVLNKNLPSIFKCQCFNNENKNFADESRETELGHLFEHIMLEYLCLGKLQNGEDEAVFEGVTNWNWKEEARGTFNIEIIADKKDLRLIKYAFKKSVNLLKKILN